MNKRTAAEIKAYIDGYNACYVSFCEFLEGHAPDAVEKMELCLKAVNAVIEERDECSYGEREGRLNEYK